jgi:UDP-2-acetamido-3-amino-2,3-dideoxy-glucuronate N-acetyltransferase
MEDKQEYFVHESAIIDKGAQIGRNTKVWHFCHVMGTAVIGDNCSIGQNCFIASGVILGSNVKIQNNVSVYEGVICGDNVFIGPSVVFTNVINPRSAVVRKNEYKKTVVEEGASIGANATIVCGNSIGKYAFVGAGAVVTKSIPAYALFVGNPAVQIGWVSEYGHRLNFEDVADGSYAWCPESGQKYQLINNEKVVRLD